MDLDAMRSFRAQLEVLSPAERVNIVNSIPVIEMAEKHATLLASPVFLLPETYDRFINATEQFVSATVAIESHRLFAAGNRLYDVLCDSLSARGKSLVNRAKKPDYQATKRRFRRLDGYILERNTPIFIEMNQSAPLAISFYERARMLTLQLGDTSESLDLYDALSQWFINEAERFGLNSSSFTVAVSMERGYPAKFIDLPVTCKHIAKAARQRGIAIEFILAEPTEFAYDNDVATVLGKRFDLLWRNTVYLQNYNEPLPQYEAIRYGDTPMINDLWSWFFRSKAFFAMIWDDSFASEFEAFGVNVAELREITPETTWISDIPDAQYKNDFILKRCDDGFGRGIAFGSELSDSEWSAYRRGDYGSDWIAQTIVRPKPVSLPIIDESGTLHDIEMVCDFDPYVVNGRMSGVLVRAMPSEHRDTKMNIVSGAAIGHVSVRRA